MLSCPEFKGKLVYFGGIEHCRFRKKVVPGDVLMLEVFSLQGENLPMENVYSGISRVGILWERNASFVGPDGENIKLMTKL